MKKRFYIQFLFRQPNQAPSNNLLIERCFISSDCNGSRFYRPEPQQQVRTSSGPDVENVDGTIREVMVAPL